MANSVTQPALSLGPIESTSGNSANSANNAIKNADNGSFSRLMSERSGPGTDVDQRSADRLSSTDASGKNLPPGRLEAAEAGAETQTPRSTATSIEAQDTDALDLTTPDTIMAPALKADASPGGLAPAGTVSADTPQAVQRSSAVSEASELSSDAQSTRVAAAASIAVSAQESELPVSGSKVAPEVTPVPGQPTSHSAAVVSAATGIAEGLRGTGTATSDNSGMIVGQAAENGLGTSRSAAVVSAATAPVDSVFVGKQTASTGAAGTSVLPAVAADADGRMLIQENGRILIQENDSNVLTRSRTDWLRSPLGPDAQPAVVVGSQIDELVESVRTATLQPRLDSASPALSPSSSPATLAPPVTGLPPAPSSSPGAILGANQGALPDYTMRYGPGDAQFPDEVTARMKTLLRDGVREARLHLHPAELGRLYVSVVTEGDQARVTFLAETSAARDSIEQSMPRLREMLEQNGLELAQSDVGHRDFHSDRRGNEVSQSARLANEADEASETDLGEQPMSLSSRSRIDTYI